MKFLLIPLLVLSFSSNAGCFMPARDAYVRYCPVDPGVGQYGPNACPMGGAQPWTDISGSLLPTSDDVQTCQGFWVETADEVRNAEPSTGSGGFSNEQLQKLFSILMYCAACICFCLGFNANEGSAK